MKKKQKTSRKAPPKKAKAPSKSYKALIIAAVIIIIAIAGTAIYYMMAKGAVSANDPISNSATVVIVNGHKITQSQLNFQYNLLPAEYKTSFTKDQVLEQIIDEEVIVQAAHKQGLDASTEDIHARVQEIMARNQLTIKDLEENLQMLNFTTDAFESLIGRQITIERYLNKTVQTPEISEQMISDVYDKNKEQYAVKEQVSVRHILISNQRDNAAVLAKEIYDKVKAGEDFCKLVLNTSDDRGSRDTCGVYTFPRGFMVPEFEKASFDMKDNEFRLVQSTFGYHIIEKLNSTPAGVKSLSDVHDTIKDDLASQAHTEAYAAIVKDLRAQATIKYANGTVMPTADVVAAPPQQEAQPAASPEHDLYACIAANTKLYGTSWNTDSQDAVAMFKAQGVNVNYIECADNKECSWVKGYPTWRIKDREFIGKMTLDQLRVAADC